MSRVPIRLPAKRSKYRAVRTTVDGITFGSKKEAARYLHLKQVQGLGLISELIANKAMLRFPLIVNGVPICMYEADFSYLRKGGERIIEDCKGYKKGAAWRMFVVKRALMKACHGIEVVEV